MKKIRTSNAFIFLMLFAFAFTFCSRQTLYRDNLKITNNIWNYKHPFSTNFEIHDTTSGFNFFIDLNITDSYPYSNIYFFVTTTMPGNDVLVDTINCLLTDGKGKWLGNRRFSEIKNHLLYKSNVRFPEKGLYKLQITQAMRLDDLPGIKSCGITIKKFKY